MASKRLKTTKDGRRYYEIRCKISRDRPEITTRWYVPDGWSAKAIDRELTKQAAEFERRCKSGEVLSHTELKEKAKREAREAAAIQTLKQYGEGVFMPAKAVRCSENTRSSFQGMLNKHIYPVLGDIKMPEIKSAQITKLLLNVQAEGKAHATVVKIYNILNLLFKMAYLGDMIDRNPMDKVERPRPRKEEVCSGEVESYTAEELRYILQCVDKEPLKWRAMLHLLIDTGIRRGEACGLQWKHINFANHSITIAGNLCYTAEKGIYLDTPKSRKIRTIDIDPAITALFWELRLDQSQKAISQYVFTQEGSSEPMHPQTPTRYMQKFAKRYGIEHLHPHKLRHSFASIAIVNGADIASVSEKLGHADKSTTLRLYTHADQESIKQVSNIFREAIKLQKKA